MTLRLKIRICESIMKISCERSEILILVIDNEPLHQGAVRCGVIDICGVDLAFNNYRDSN